MIQLPHIHARIGRLTQFTHGRAKEVIAWKDDESPLSPRNSSHQGLRQRRQSGRM